MGIFYALLSAVFSSAKDLVSKKLAYQIDGMTSTFASFAFALPFYVVVLIYLFNRGEERFSYSMAFLWLVFMRSVTDVLAEGMKMYAFSHADISVVACFFSLSPLLLLITSPLITGDPLSVPGVLATLLVVGGSFLLVYRASDRSWAEQKKGIFLALGASFFFSLNTCFDRLAVKEETGTPVFAGFGMTLFSALLIMPLVIFRRDRVEALGKYQNGLWIRGFMEVTFMSAKLTALTSLDGPQVVSIQRVALLLSILGGRIFFQEKDFARRLAAGLIILAGALIVIWWDYLMGLFAN
jgi:drug/metabolite transporter (DMT)-like permease